MRKKGYHFGSHIETVDEFHAVQGEPEIKNEKQLSMFDNLK